MVNETHSRTVKFPTRSTSSVVVKSVDSWQQTTKPTVATYWKETELRDGPAARAQRPQQCACSTAAFTLF